MATRASHNKNSSAVKRIMSEAKELQNDNSTEYKAGPLEDDIFEWHCTIRGPPDTEFEGGLYHCRISLPSEYPFKAPSIMVLTPNGRFELNKKLCISFTSYHEELWQPAWGVRTAIIGLQGFFPLKGEAAIGVGAIEYPIVERKRLATLSRHWTCPDCKMSNIELLPDPPVDARTPEVEVPVTNAPQLAEPQTVHAEAPDTSFLVATNTTPIIEFIENTEHATAPTSASPADNEPPIIGFDTPALLPRWSVAALNTVDRDRVDTDRSRNRNRPPLWIDLSIVFFSFIFAYIAGKRLFNVWDVVTEHA